jgi:hypothetical protein
MLQSLGNLLGGRSQQKGGVVYPAPKVASPISRRDASERKPTYSKVFRWRKPDGQVEEPGTVEVVGSFTDWQRVPLQLDAKVNSWHTTIPNIPGNKTHHYMLLVDGQPAADKGCDGYALPQGAQEERYAITTVRGPRLYMLFAQTK